MFHKVAWAGWFSSLRDICQVSLTPGQFLLLAHRSQHNGDEFFFFWRRQPKVVVLTFQITHVTFTKQEENFPVNLKPRFNSDMAELPWRPSPATLIWQMWLKGALKVQTPSSGSLALAHDVRCDSCHYSWMSPQQNAIFSAPILQTPAARPAV